MVEAALQNPTFWVAIAFFVFIAGIVYAKAHKSIGDMLDARAEAITAQIEEAKALKAEAENLLTEYQRKQRDAEKEAIEMIEQAKEDAKLMSDAAKANLDAMMVRRERAAAEKIAQAEASAIKEVRAAAVDVAISAATTVLGGAMKGKAGTALVDDAIKEVDGKLH